MNVIYCMTINEFYLLHFLFIAGRINHTKTYSNTVIQAYMPPPPPPPPPPPHVPYKCIEILSYKRIYRRRRRRRRHHHMSHTSPFKYCHTAATFRLFCLFRLFRLFEYLIKLQKIQFSKKHLKNFSTKTIIIKNDILLNIT